jgi:DNA-binding MarR family transcriptional regulator
MSDFIALFTKTSKVVRASAETVLRRHGLHVGQNLVLEALWETDGQTPGEIAARLSVTTPTVVKMATRMSQSGLLTRRRDHADTRLVRLYLTGAGRALQQPIEAELRRIDAHLTADLTATEKQVLMSALEKVARAAATLHPDPVHET